MRLCMMSRFNGKSVPIYKRIPVAESPRRHTYFWRIASLVCHLASGTALTLALSLPYRPKESILMLSSAYSRRQKSGFASRCDLDKGFCTGEVITYLERHLPSPHRVPDSWQGSKRRPRSALSRAETLPRLVYLHRWATADLAVVPIARAG